MAAPWLNTTTRPPGWAAAMRSTARAQAAPEHLARLGAGDHVPALLGHDLLEQGVAVGRLLAQQAALPLAEEHLAQVGVDDRGHAASAPPAAPPSGPCAAAW